MLSFPAAESPFGGAQWAANPLARISALGVEHDDLDAAIDALANANTIASRDDLIIVRLKKRKLQIRDEIAGLVAAVAERSRQDAGVANG